MPRLDKNKFWKDVSDRCNYIGVDTVRSVYYALMKELINEMLDKGSICMPDWGKFEIRTYAQRRFTNMKTGKLNTIYEHKRINFAPNKKLKSYIRNS